MAADLNTAGPPEASGDFTGPGLFLGTCAWSFGDWRGVFYPDKLPADSQLEWYARWFGAVEIDASFYHAPRAEVAARWTERTPAGFRFTAKLPRALTHEARLRCGGRELRAFLGALRPLGSKLAVVLVQLPPSFAPRPDDEAALLGFLDEIGRLETGAESGPEHHPLPGAGRTGAAPAHRPRFAVEFRHPGWAERGAVVARMRAARVAWVWSDRSTLAAAAAAPAAAWPDTADFRYVRLLGDLDTKYGADGSRRFRYDGSLRWPREAALAGWARRLAAGWPGETYVLVNNHYEGFSPLTCRRLAARLGRPGPDWRALPPPGATPPRQDPEQLSLW